MRLIDLVGRRFGRLIVVARAPKKPGYNDPFWRCQCDCSNVIETSGQLLRSVKTQSCGCRRQDLLTKHGGSGTPEYDSWKAMISRCQEPSNKAYRLYGARGIKVCEAWQSFKAFLHDMGPRPVATTLDRIENDGNYEPSNCRWSSASEQQSNKRSNHRLTFSGRTQTVRQWAREIGVNEITLHARLDRGWSVERALSSPTDIRFSRRRSRARAAGSKDNGSQRRTTADNGSQRPCIHSNSIPLSSIPLHSSPAITTPSE